MVRVKFRKIFIVTNVFLLLGTLLSFVFLTNMRVRAAAPSNTTSGTAIDITSLPYTNIQNVHDAGTTYDVWYKYTADFDGVISVWGFGDLVGYSPGYTIYSPNASTVYFDMDSAVSDKNRPLYIPVQDGVTYYFWFWNSTGDPSPANLTVSVEAAPDDDAETGDFITNYEVDNDYEFPLAVLDGTNDYTAIRYEQMSSPAGGVRGNDGLPHGTQGAILDNGNFIYADEQYLKVKIYDKDFNLVSNITDYVGTNTSFAIGVSRELQKFYIAHKPVSGLNPFHVDERSSDGTETDTWTLTGITSLAHIAVNADASILYYNQGGTSAIKRWDLVNDIALSDLVADTAGHRIEDLLYLEDDTLLALWHEEGTTPRDVKVKRYNTTGTVLNTYDFGDTWRSEFNPPRIGFALDSPDSFWIVLKPESAYQQSIFRNILISDGSTIDEVTHVNYLFGKYIGSATATPEGLFGPEKSFPVLVMPQDSTPSTPNFDLSIEKTVSDSTPEEGDVITLTTTVTNNGPDDATDIEVTDTLPSELVFDSYVSSQGTYDETTWLVGDLDNSESATLEITATLNSEGESFDNTTEISSPADSDSGDNESTVTITPVEFGSSSSTTSSGSGTNNAGDNEILPAPIVAPPALPAPVPTPLPTPPPTPIFPRSGLPPQ